MKHLFIFAAALAFTACAYDNYTLEVTEEPDDGSYYVLTDLAQSGYSEWIYINLETGEYETHPDSSVWYYTGDGSFGNTTATPEAITIDWHIAAHRYQFMTNGASVMYSEETDITAITELPDGDYTADEEAPYLDEVELEDGVTLIADMAGMMSGNIGYIYRPTINRLLCKAITRSGSMGSYVYSYNEGVYILKWDDGRWAKFQLTGLNSSRGTSGYLNFNYKLNN